MIVIEWWKAALYVSVFLGWVALVSFRLGREFEREDKRSITPENSDS